MHIVETNSQLSQTVQERFAAIGEARAMLHEAEARLREENNELVGALVQAGRTDLLQLNMSAIGRWLRYSVTR